MKSTQSSWLSKLKVISGALSTVLLSGGLAVAQNDFDFSSLPQQQRHAQTQDSQSSQARIITGDNRLRNSTPTTLGELAPLRRDGLSQQPTYAASNVSPQMTEQQSSIRPTNHLTSSVATPTRLYQLANCDWRQFEYNLLNMWMSQPQVQPLQDGQIMRVTIPSSDPNTSGTMLINRKDSTVYFEGADSAIMEWNEAIRVLDREQKVDGETVKFIGTAGLSPSELQKVNYMVRAKQQEQDQETMRAVPLPGGATNQDEGEVGGPVEARVIPSIGQMILKGSPQDVDDLERQIKEFIERAQAAQPQPKRFDLKNADPQTAADTLQLFYDAQLAEEQGPASIAPMQNPKGLLVVAKGPALNLIEGIIRELDKDTAQQDASKDFKVYKLQHVSSIDAQQRINEYFGRALDSGSGGDPVLENVLVISDPRANILIVRATPSYLAQVDKLVETLDVAGSDATREIRLIKLRNTLAAEIAPVIQAAINGTDAIVPNGNQAQGQLQNQNQIQQGPTGTNRPQTSLQMMTLDRQGNAYRTGILFDVQITADSGSNSLVVVAPSSSMPLIEALVDRLDVVPDIETQIKVFQVINGDATTLIEMLNTLFGGDNQGANNAANGTTTGTNTLPLQTATAGEGQSLANLRFTLDERTNSIIASGPVGDLEVVKNLLTRLDEDDVNRRQVTVVRLNNAYAVDVADAVNNWLTERTNLVTNNFTGNFVANKREVIVVPEIVTNSLIISALPQYYSEVIQVIESIDRRPPMVKVKVTLAEVNLNALEEFGVEIGIQDALLFDRGQSLANPLSTALLTTGENLAGTARAAFGVGTAGSGFGGFTLSAGNESINLLMRSLKSRNCLRVLSRPHLMTIENLQGRITVGANIPRVTGTTIAANGLAQTNVTPIDVGVTLEVTPRVSPDGMIVMFVNAINSSLADAGIVVGTDANGNAIESPIINQTAAQTTVMGRSGQTIVLSGLIQETKSQTNRGVPILSGLPIFGPLFGFQADEAQRSELLIIMTPELVLDDATLRQQNNEEMDRMHWCMCDVAEIHGNTGYDGNQSFQSPATFYPDADPSGLNPVQPQFEMETVPGMQPQLPGQMAPQSNSQQPRTNRDRITQDPRTAQRTEPTETRKRPRRGLFNFR
jgi:type II secretory pathway component GspD/PulD (secretin)